MIPRLLPLLLAALLAGCSPPERNVDTAELARQVLETERAFARTMAERDPALSTGPVRDPSGRLIGTFTSLWRQEEPGRWHIVFDRGNPACE